MKQHKKDYPVTIQVQCNREEWLECWKLGRQVKIPVQVTGLDAANQNKAGTGNGQIGKNVVHSTDIMKDMLNLTESRFNWLV